MTPDLVIDVKRPRPASSGAMHGPRIDVQPFGNGGGYMWSMTPDETQQLGDALLAAAREAKETFGLEPVD